MATTIRYGTRLEHLHDAVKLSSRGQTAVSVWINDDIRPLPPSRRTWTTMTFIGWWSVWQLSLTNWQLGGSLVASSLSVWQTMVAVILGRTIAAIVAILIGYIGAEWHIGFLVYSRAIWGVFGAFFPTLLRIGLTVVGFAFQSYTGGLCVTAILSGIFPTFFRMSNTLPPSAHVTSQQIIGWAIFNIISIPVLYRRPERSEKLMFGMNIVSFAALLGIMIWSLSHAHGAGDLIHQPSQLQTSESLGFGIMQGITTVVGTLSIALNDVPNLHSASQMDFSRFAQKPSDQVFGQWFTFIIIGSIMPLFGCLTSSATQAIYGEALWNPPTILAMWLQKDYSSTSRAAAVQSVPNLWTGYSVGMDLSGLLPKYINIRRGCYVGLILGMALCPWELLASATTFVSVISSFSIFMAPFCGIHIGDYWFIRQRRLKLSDLYHARPEGIYFYTMGFNWRSVLPWLVGWVPLLPGFMHSINPAIQVSVGADHLYALGFPYGLLSSMAIHTLVNKCFPPPGVGEIDRDDTYGTFTVEEAAKLGVNKDSTEEDSDRSLSHESREAVETKV
ncbi:permease for cytosine/purines, uracil, thiamine, allantoin-domain-containing protein [Aspergillus pseudotamarii]|uniref:Permease for cytosine/purines, uracil, thiamine, allantoin-domain-containing protein n=1 Tax=Aspergillus pseudotamarii TaxID=132259 RepID=A0A5N6SWI7_ASPPS|nr:permease for cytosine/purines, uracil, thiamine, allantoin-domain-containing protein [Aspergillus pseudotamarii]KAE8137494.1 permease for cytosine/purines, uracil, thiamine, allantoin-domain-containing protein [Aspergillus pseudotamarii]